MAALAPGLIRILQPGLASVLECHGPAIWYGFLAVRLVALFVADGSWSSIKKDFTCNDTITDFCKGACFNIHFNYPVSALWGFSFVAALLPVILFKMLTNCLSKVPKNPDNSCPEGEAHQIVGSSSNVGLVEKTASKELKNTSASHLPHILSVLLLFSIEGAFLWVLLSVQLPKVSQQTFVCKTPLCPGQLECLIFSQVDKVTAIFTLAFTSVCVFVVGLAHMAYWLLEILKHR
uniref:Connexin N-terminal domain-containing protein n=1 Tax=Latimeria chalumnae TaxID=7897 RepID=H3ARP0_LATCH